MTNEDQDEKSGSAAGKKDTKPASKGGKTKEDVPASREEDADQT